jgi:hypothetical protein
MNVARDHFLAGARLAQNQHAGIERRDLLDQAMHRAHRARSTAWTKSVGARLRRMAVAHVLRLIQDRRQAPLFDRKFEVKPSEVAAGLRDFWQTVAGEIDDRQRLGYRAQLLHQFGALSRDGFLRDDDGQPIVSGATLILAQFLKVVHMDRLEIQKSQHRHQCSRLRI